MHENHDFVAPVNIFIPFTHALFSWAAQHSTVCLDIRKLLSWEPLGDHVCPYRLG